MNNNILNTKTPAEELIVIPDECGDSLWDAVLEQDLTTVEANNIASVSPAEKLMLYKCVMQVKLNR